MGYFSRTGTVGNLDKMRSLGWGILICASTRPSSEHRDEGFSSLMLDNGAWKCRKEPDPLAHWLKHYRAPFESLLERFGPRADHVVLPDIVGGGASSLELSKAWAPRLRSLPALLPVQDGMTADMVAPLVGPELGIFVGGSTDWKWSTLRTTWGPLARDTGCHLHVGRAGSARQVARCSSAGAHSFDTSQPSRYRCKAPGLDNARRQGALMFGGEG